MKRSFVIVVLLVLLLLVGGVGATTATFSTVNETDGHIGVTAASSTLQGLTDDTTGTVDITGTVSNIYLRASTTSGEFNLLQDGYLIFNTSALPDDATITSAKLRLYGQTSGTGLGVPGLVITGWMPDTDYTIATGDFDSKYNDRYSVDFPQGSWSIAAYNNLTLNSLAISNVSKTGNTNLSARLAWSVNNSFDGTWASTGVSQFAYWMRDSGITKNPILEIEYTSAGGDTTPPISILSLTNETPTGSSIKWNWVLQTDADRAGIGILKNGTWDNVSAATTTVTWTGLPSETVMFFNSTTFDAAGNQNLTHWQNLSATTGTASSSAQVTVVFYPVSSGDTYELTDAAFTFMRAAPGDGIHNNITRASSELLASSDSDAETYSALYRGYFIFDTSSLPDAATIDTAELSISGYTIDSTFLYNAEFGLTGFNPAIPGTMVAGDHDTFEDTRFAPDVNSDDITELGAGYGNHWNFTSAGVSAVNQTGYTNLMMRTAWDIDNEEPSWGADAIAWFNYYANTPGSYPNLTVRYRLLTDPPVSNFTANVTYGRSPLAVGFTDTSTSFPTGWSWAYKNATTDWTSFSTDQYPQISLPNGVYDINLTTTNAYGSDDEVKTTYITSSSSYPVAAFSGTPLSGPRPLAVQFTDESDAEGISAWLWDFGDGVTTGNTLQNPLHTYTAYGCNNVSLTVTNATGADTETKAGYVCASNPTVSHPISYDVRQSPGYLLNTTEPWATAWNDTIAESDRAYNRDYTTYLSGGINRQGLYGNSNGAMYMAIRYQITRNPKYIDQIVSALSTVDTMSYTSKTVAGTSCWNLGDASVAYDLAYQGMDAANRSLLANKLTYIADMCYISQNATGVYSPTQISFADYHQHMYTNIGIAGLIFSDYTNGSQTTNANQWVDLGEASSWTFDQIHPTLNKGLYAEVFGMSSGAQRLGAYEYYDDWGAYELWNIWSNVNGRSYLDEFPEAKRVATHLQWQILPQHVLPSFNTDGNVDRVTPKILYSLMDETNRSALKWSIDQQESTSPVIVSTTLGTPRQSGIFLCFEDYRTLSTQPRTETAFAEPDGEYDVIRSDWSDQAEWISMVKYKSQSYSSGSRIWGEADQLSFEYSSHGDLLMPDHGETKYAASPYNVYGGRGTDSNSLVFGNGSVLPFPKQLNNLTYRGTAKQGRSITGGVYYPQNTVNTTAIIKTDQFKYTEGNLVTKTLEDTGTSVLMYLPNAITYQRGTGIVGNGDYTIVIDRATSPGVHDYVNTFQFASLKFTNAGMADLVTADNFNSSGAYSNGSMTIGGSAFDWHNQPMTVEVDLPAANRVGWNTTSPYGDDVSLELFSAPQSPISFQKYLNRISFYMHPSQAGNFDGVQHPRVFFHQDANKTLYRVTALLTRYSNETASTPSELTVTGTGSAISILSTDGLKTDTIYTGTGNSTLSNGINTDADTAFARKVGSGFSDFTTINGTHLYDGPVSLFNSSTRLTYLSANMSATGAYTVSVSGTSSLATLKFYNITSNPTYVLIDGVEPSWSRSGTTLTIITPLSDHIITFDGGAGYSTTIPPVASFTPTGMTTGTVPFSVSFTDTSSNAPSSWAWAFGDGNTTENTLQNPVHLYTAAGNYSVSLTATNVYGSDVSDQVTWVNASALASPVANFTATPLSGQAPLLVTFTDSSTNAPTAWEWDYSNASVTWTRFSTVQNPTITLPEGVYNFRLNASNAFGFNMKTRSGGYVTVSQAFPCGANYAVYQDHWAKCSGTDYVEMWNSSGTFNAPTWINNVSYRLRGGGAGGNGYGAENAQNGWGGYAGSVATGYSAVTGGTAYTVSLGTPGATGTNGLNGCPSGSSSGTATTFNGLSAAGGVGARFNPTTSYCELMYNTGWQGEAGDPDLNYGGGGNGGICTGVGCSVPSAGTSGKPGYATLTYSTALPVASFTPLGEVAAYDVDIITFTDTSTGTPNAWQWAYTPEAGVKTTFSALQNPQYIFPLGNNSISLNASNSMGSAESTQVTWINVTAAPENPNPGATLQVVSIPRFANLTQQNVTIQMKNVNITNNISMTVTYPRLPLYIVSVLPNRSAWEDVALTKMIIDNSTGTIQINATRPGGFTTNGLADNEASFADIKFLYPNYTHPIFPVPSERISVDSILLRNATAGIDYPIITPADIGVDYDEWVTFSNFTVSDTNPLANSTTVHFVPEMNFTATEWLWDYGDGTTETCTDGLGSHLYSTPGWRDVNLTARLIANASITNTTSLHYALNVSYDPAYVKADFSATPLTGNVGTLVIFSDLSEWGTDAATSGRTYNWSFGDYWYSPTPFSDIAGGVSHVYTANGIYSVNLTINNTLSGDYELKTNYITISNTQQQATVNWQPHSVAIQVVDANYNPIVGNPVYVNAHSSSLPGGLSGAVNYFTNAYGVTGDVALSMFTAETTYYGTTDDNGFIALQVVDVIQYKVITKDTTGTNTTRLFWPAGPYYQIVTGTAAVAGIAAQGRAQAAINMNSTFNTTFWEPNTSYSCMGVMVYDSTGGTSNVYAWWKLLDNETMWWTNSTAIGGYGPINSTKCVLHVPYQRWRWGGMTS